MPGTGAQNETPEHRPEMLLAPNARVETAVPSSHVEGRRGPPPPFAALKTLIRKRLDLGPAES